MICPVPLARQSNIWQGTEGPPFGAFGVDRAVSAASLRRVLVHVLPDAVLPDDLFQWGMALALEKPRLETTWTPIFQGMSNFGLFPYFWGKSPRNGE